MRVYRTQPAVSIAIRRLEEEIGSPLFERSQKTPVLTDAGELLYDYAKRILSLRDQTFNVVAELKSLRRGRVRIGANESTSLYLLPHLILEYRALHPDVMVEIFRQSSERLPREVLDRNVDFALMAFEPVDSDLESFPVLRDELVLITHPEHHLAKLQSVTVEELGNQPFLAHNVKTGSRYKVMETFAQHHTPLNITLELATVETIKRFVQLKDWARLCSPHVRGRRTGARLSGQCSGRGSHLCANALGHASSWDDLLACGCGLSRDSPRSRQDSHQRK